LFVAIACDQTDQRPMPFCAACWRRAASCARHPRETTVESSNELFNEILCRSAADISMLMTDTRRALPLCRHPLVFDHVRRAA